MTFGAAAALTAVLAGAPVAQAASVPRDDVPFETLGIVSATAGINLLEGSAIAIRADYEIDEARDLLATGYDGSFARQVMAMVDEVPDDRVLLVGMIESGCTPAKQAGLERTKDGELVMTAPGHVEEHVECFVAVISVAVLSVDADEVPVGAADGVSLVDLELTSFATPDERTAVEMTRDDRLLLDILPEGSELPELPPLEPAHRRFGFVRSGCANTTAEMIVTPQLLDVRLGYDEPGLVVNCARAEFFVTVFDVPDSSVRETAQLVGG